MAISTILNRFMLEKHDWFVMDALGTSLSRGICEIEIQEAENHACEAGKLKDFTPCDTGGWGNRMCIAVCLAHVKQLEGRLLWFPLHYEHVRHLVEEGRSLPKCCAVCNFQSY